MRLYAVDVYIFKKKKTASNCSDKSSFGKNRFEEMTTQMSQYITIRHNCVKFEPLSPIFIKLINYDRILCKKKCKWF